MSIYISVCKNKMYSHSELTIFKMLQLSVGKLTIRLKLTMADRNLMASDKYQVPI